MLPGRSVPPRHFLFPVPTCLCLRQRLIRQHPPLPVALFTLISLPFYIPGSVRGLQTCPPRQIYRSPPHHVEELCVAVKFMAARLHPCEEVLLQDGKPLLIGGDAATSPQMWGGLCIRGHPGTSATTNYKWDWRGSGRDSEAGAQRGKNNMSMAERDWFNVSAGRARGQQSGCEAKWQPSAAGLTNTKGMKISR